MPTAEPRRREKESAAVGREGADAAVVGADGGTSSVRIDACRRAEGVVATVAGRRVVGLVEGLTAVSVAVPSWPAPASAHPNPTAEQTAATDVLILKPFRRYRTMP
jgi:hypothetical protein